MAGKDDVVAVHVIARNGGQSYGAQGQVLLTLKVLPHSYH